MDEFVRWLDDQLNYDPWGRRKAEMEAEWRLLDIKESVKDTYQDMRNMAAKAQRDGLSCVMVSPDDFNRYAAAAKGMSEVEGWRLQNSSPNGFMLHGVAFLRNKPLV